MRQQLKITSILTLGFTIALLAGCQLQTYRSYFQQGNIWNESQQAKLHTGMSKEAVVNLMGTPVYANAFSTQDWVYVYFKQSPQEREQKQLILRFEGDRLAQITNG